MAISNVVESEVQGAFPIPWWRVVIGSHGVVRSITIADAPDNRSERGVYYVQCPTPDQAELLAEKRRYQNVRGPNQNRKRAEWKAAGLCVGCGRVRDTPNQLCASCSVAQRRSQQKLRRRKVWVLADHIASIEFAVLSEVLHVWRNKPNLKFDQWLMREIDRRKATSRLSNGK
jgi:hypothetical protein